jgi:hypothetical protein
VITNKLNPKPALEYYLLEASKVAEYRNKKRLLMSLKDYRESITTPRPKIIVL